MIDVPRELVDLVEEHGFQSEWNALIDSIAELEAEVLHENDLFITWRAKAEDLQVRIAELEQGNE